MLMDKHFSSLTCFDCRKKKKKSKLYSHVLHESYFKNIITIWTAVRLHWIFGERLIHKCLCPFMVLLETLQHKHLEASMISPVRMLFLMHVKCSFYPLLMHQCFSAFDPWSHLSFSSDFNWSQEKFDNKTSTLYLFLLLPTFHAF